MSDDSDARERIEGYMRRSVELKASDLYLTVEAPPMCAVYGELVPIGDGDGVKLTAADTRQLIYSLLNDERRKIFDDTGDLDFSHGIAGVSRFRVNIFRQRGACGLVARIIPSKIRTLEELGMPEILYTLARKHNGLVLVTGPTGSGKSTTLAAMVDLINNERACHMITLEDPIEYLHRHKRSIINQREIYSDTVSFARGIKAAMREAPQVILVGEMRDFDTIGAAITAAETGHLVFSTLHTQDAAQTIDRIIDVFPPHQQAQVRIQLSGTIQGIVAQQLVPRADQPGRQVCFEVLVATPAIRNLIREGKTHQIPSAIQTGAKYGMKTLESSLREAYQRGLISEDDYRNRLATSALTGLSQT
jgi:twitching motility protein PilT